MDIDEYFEMYLNSRIKYDRLYHIKNLNLDRLTVITDTIVKKIFTYLDSVLFNKNLTEYTTNNSIDLQFIVSKALTTTAGMFFRRIIRGNTKVMGFKISYNFFQNIIDNKTLNVNLGSVNEKNEQCYSTTYIEPLLTTMEHEIIHMLMHITSNNKFNDSRTVKSGHTKVFKKLVYNIFGHVNVTHRYSIGDVVKNEEIKGDINIGDYVKDIESNINGYVVSKKNRNLILCAITNSGNVYKALYYKDVVKVDTTVDKINIVDLINKLQPDVKIKYNNIIFTITKVNSTTVTAITVDKKIYRIPTSRILDIIFMD